MGTQTQRKGKKETVCYIILESVSERDGIPQPPPSPLWRQISCLSCVWSSYVMFVYYKKERRRRSHSHSECVRRVSLLPVLFSLLFPSKLQIQVNSGHFSCRSHTYTYKRSIIQDRHIYLESHIRRWERKGEMREWVRLTHSWKGRKNLASYVKGRGTSESEERKMSKVLLRRETRRWS